MSKVSLTKEQKFTNDCKQFERDLSIAIKSNMVKSNKTQKDLKTFESQSTASRKLSNPLNLTVWELLHIVYELDDYEKFKSICYNILHL